MKVLVVEDSKTMRRIVRGQIMAGWPDAEVVGVDSVAAAREFLAGEDAAVDLILLDYHLPGEVGTALLKKFDEFNTPPVVMLTAEADKSLMVEALRAGARGYLVKPVSAADLRSELAHYLGPPVTESSS
jgi:two-component system chemotaxis response regulator CheY